MQGQAGSKMRMTITTGSSSWWPLRVEDVNLQGLSVFFALIAGKQSQKCQCAWIRSHGKWSHSKT